MKKQIMLLAVFMLLVQWAAQAQFTDQGNFIIGSTVGFSRADSKTMLQSTGDIEEAGPSSFHLNVAPKLGYFLFDDFTLGIGLDYTLSSSKQPSEDRVDASNLLFGPFGRYYFPAGKEVYVFGELNFGFGNSSDIQTIGGKRQSVNTNIFAAGAGPGLTIISSNGLGIEAMFKYNYARSRFDTEIDAVKAKTTTRANHFSISVGMTLYFEGIRRAGY